MLPLIADNLYNKVQNFNKGLNMPRVVPDQREKFENDELFRKLSRVAEVCNCDFYRQKTDKSMYCNFLISLT